MLVSLELTNFRCFKEHKVLLQAKSLVVGKNNAGKSTCVEALRIVSLVTERLKNLPVKSPPPGIGLSTAHKGLRPRLDSIAIHKESIFHRYGSPPALIVATFSNNSFIKIYVGEKLQVHALVYNQSGKLAKSRSAIEESKIPTVSILPQIGPLLDEERKRDDDYVKRNVQSTLSSRHFRNQIRIFKDSFFAEFKQLVSSTWPDLVVSDLLVPGILDDDDRINLFVRDGDFEAEVAWMGHGLQMWLQTMWFLSRSTRASVLILDEPDVYMHADLQRKLIRLLMKDERQFIVATHSPEMLEEVEPENIVVLDRQNPVSRNATSSTVVQGILDNIGSVHNLSLARIGICKRVLLLEGDDLSLLKKFQKSIGRSEQVSIETIPNCDIEGWSKWPSVLTLSKFLRKNSSENVTIFCVLDRDYHTDEEIQSRLEDARKAKIKLHVWERKELENYAISSNAIARLISRETGTEIASKVVEQKISEISEEMKDSAIDICSEDFRVRLKKGANVSNPLARTLIKERWKKLGGAGVVNGKVLFSKIAAWCRSEHDTSISLHRVILEMEPSEVPLEMKTLIESITHFDH